MIIKFLLAKIVQTTRMEIHKFSALEGMMFLGKKNE